MLKIILASDNMSTIFFFLRDEEMSLYLGCTKFTQFFIVLWLFNLKVGTRWSDKSVTSLLKLLKDMFLEGNKLCHTYKARKILCPMGMMHKKIHVCLKWLYYIKRNTKVKISSQNVGHYIIKRALTKVLSCLLIIPMFKCMFVITKDAKSLSWHANLMIFYDKL